MFKKILIFTFFCLPLFAQYNRTSGGDAYWKVRSVTDTTQLKTVYSDSVGDIVYLSKIVPGAEKETRGWFVYVDSAYTEDGGYAFGTGANGYQWVRDEYLENPGWVNVDWYGAGDSSNVSDSYDEIQQAVDTGLNVRFSSGKIYKIKTAVRFNTLGQLAVGGGRGTAQTQIIMDVSDMGADPDTCMIDIGGSFLRGGFENLFFAYMTLPASTDTSVVFKCASNAGELTFKNVWASQVWGLTNNHDGPGLWNCNFIDVEMDDWSGWAIFNAPASGGVSGNVFTNLYLNGSVTDTCLGAVYLDGNTNVGHEDVFNMLNIESFYSTNPPIYLAGAAKVVFNCIHFEQVTLYSASSYLIYSPGGENMIEVNNLTVDNCTLTDGVTTRFALFYMDGAKNRLIVNNAYVRGTCTFDDLGGVYNAFYIASDVDAASGARLRAFGVVTQESSFDAEYAFASDADWSIIDRENRPLMGWVTHSAATDTTTLGSLPSDAIVTHVIVYVDTAFNSDGADNLIVGFTADSDGYVTTVDVSSTGLKTVTYGAHARRVQVDARTAVIYYDDAGSDATEGHASVVLEWIEGKPIPDS